MQTTTISITGMTCGHCVAAVTSALEKISGVSSVKVSLEQAQAVVEGTADLKTLVDAVTEEGYTAQQQQ